MKSSRQDDSDNYTFDIFRYTLKNVQKYEYGKTIHPSNSIKIVRENNHLLFYSSDASK